MPDRLAPEPFGIEGARDALTSGGGAAVPPPPAGALFAVTLHLLDGSSVPAGSDTHDGIANMRAMIDARTALAGQESAEPADVWDADRGRRTLIVNAGTDRGWIVPAASIVYVSWSPDPA